MTGPHRAAALAAALALILGGTASADNATGFYFGLNYFVYMLTIGAESACH